jgi:3-oxoacyl-[acyl-carrier-protein] synthase II
MSQPRRRRIVVTGLGVCAANGANIPEFQNSLQNGASGIREITDFDTLGYRNRSAGVVEQCQDGLRQEDANLDRASLLALKSVYEAVADAKLDIDSKLAFRSAVSVGTSLGGMHSHVRRMRGDFVEDPKTDFEGPYADLLDVPPCQIANLICHRLGVRGGNSTVVTACSAGTNSIAVALDWIRQDRVDVVIASATDPLCELSFSGFNILMALSPTLSRPFDQNRDGLVVGEGAGTLILEDYEHALARGAQIYAEITGYGLSNDAFHPTQPDPEAGGACRAIRRALNDAGMALSDINYINAHGTATRYNDDMELRAVSTVYGDLMPDIPMSSIKSMIGHTLGAAGTIEAIATVLALKYGFLPPTINTSSVAEGYPYDCVPVSRDYIDLNHACSHSFGFGGNATCLVMSRDPKAYAVSAPLAGTIN